MEATIAPASVIDRQAVCAVAQQVALIRGQTPESPVPDTVLDALTRFQQAIVLEALTRLESDARDLLAYDDLVMRMAADEIRAGTPQATADVLKAIDVAMEGLQSTHDRTLKLKDFSGDVRVRRVADVVIAAARSLYERIEVRRQVSLESEAEGDIEAGRLRKFGNARAAVAHLKRLQKR